MRFNPKARVDQSQVEDVGGSGGGFGGGLGGGGMGLPIPTGGGGKIGIGTIIIFVLFFVVTQCLGSGTTTQSAVPPDTTSTTQTDSGTTCATGEDANNSDKCAIALFSTSVQDYWRRTLPQQANIQYTNAPTVLFNGATASGCGQASSQMGPFYCPNDKKVYLDSTFFRDMLQGQLGAQGGVFSIGYVVAHEYGHHIEDELGILGRIRSQQGADSDAVKVELMADCLAGMWAKDAQTTRDADGNTIIEGLTTEDIKLAIDAAQAVGDDRIQEKTSGRVDPESWTHGSAEQRQQAFMTGYNQGSLQACNYFG